MSNLPVRPYITYEDLCRMPEDGNRYELIDGEIFVAPSPNTRHQRLVRRLFKAFDSAIRGNSEVFFAPFDVVLAPATSLQPDLILILEKSRHLLQDVVRGAPDLIVEVLSPSTAYMDRHRKMDAYALHSVGEYWIADSGQPAVEIYRLDRETGAYRLARICRPGDVATTPLLTDLAIDVRKLFSGLDD